MKNKEIHYPYYCKKCARTVYFDENDTINEICKICGSKMEKEKPIISHSKNTLKNVNRKGSCLTLNYQSQATPIIECPYCHSTNTQKISATSKIVHTAIAGLFAMGRNSKQWHCNSCQSDF